MQKLTFRESLAVTCAVVVVVAFVHQWVLTF
ncbi:Uncharacterised protein [Raoultella planticola]|jgi:hypothetical protein|uniref:Uncharacterized protein n=1 Tax=Raoultella planticola TaxID=575 RepID=A0A8G1ZYJ1_RAOPL|nr:hypothetical protein CIG23_18500 [Raoultella planticola]PIM85669.1 hypothetical protein CT151_07675 [Raoultella planticola]TCL51670.1 hypothetical protein EDC47_102457 [Raoultella planticola]TDV13069.1 hypothetical protein DFO76_101712 [Raoultella planticola]TDX41304.1 hypothetical protein DET60_101707 [Raoultella planticola]